MWIWFSTSKRPSSYPFRKMYLEKLDNLLKHFLPETLNPSIVYWLSRNVISSLCREWDSWKEQRAYFPPVIGTYSGRKSKLLGPNHEYGRSTTEVAFFVGEQPRYGINLDWRNGQCLHVSINPIYKEQQICKEHKLVSNRTMVNMTNLIS